MCGTTMSDCCLWRTSLVSSFPSWGKPGLPNSYTAAYFALSGRQEGRLVRRLGIMGVFTSHSPRFNTHALFISWPPVPLLLTRTLCELEIMDSGRCIATRHY